MQAIRITEYSTRPDIETAIAQLRTKQRRMPEHWTERRAEVGDEIDRLVDQWLTAGDQDHPAPGSTTDAVSAPGPALRGDT